MIVTQHPIYADEIQKKIDYITDASKVHSCRVSLSDINLLSDADWLRDFSNLVDVWASNTDYVRLVSAYRCTIDDFPQRCDYLEQLYIQARGLNKATGPIARHLVFSWPSDAQISDKEVLVCTQKCICALGPYPSILGTHVEPVFEGKLLRGLCKHCHVLICTYPDEFDTMPHKLSLGKGNIKIREINDKIGIQCGQAILVHPDLKRSQSFYMAIKAKLGESWVKDLSGAAEKAANAASNMEEYRAILHDHGYSVDRDARGLLRYYTQDGHQITAPKLGQQFTEEQLALRWEGISERTSGKFLEELQQNNGLLHVNIPLGGVPNPKTYYPFPLDESTLRYSEKTLKSYFLPGADYTITNQHDVPLATVDGGQILDLLAVDPYKTSLQQELEKARLDRIEILRERIDYQIARTCEEQIQVAQLRCKYYLERKEKEKKQDKQIVYRYDYSRRPNGEERTWLEEFFLLICTICIPDFFIEDYSYCYQCDEYDPVAKKYTRLTPKDPVTLPAMQVTCSELQPFFDMLITLRQEGICANELKDAARSADVQYNFIRDGLTLVTEKLEHEQELYDTIREYIQIEPQVRAAVLQARGDLDILEINHKELLDKYRNIVNVVRSYAIENWINLNQIADEYKYLASLKPMLEKAAAAEYERREKLELAQYTYALKQVEIELESRKYIYRPYVESEENENYREDNHSFLHRLIKKIQKISFLHSDTTQKDNAGTYESLTPVDQNRSTQQIAIDDTKSASDINEPCEVKSSLDAIINNANTIRVTQPKTIGKEQKYKNRFW